MGKKRKKDDFEDDFDDDEKPKKSSKRPKKDDWMTEDDDSGIPAKNDDLNFLDEEEGEWDDFTGKETKYGKKKRYSTDDYDPTDY